MITTPNGWNRQNQETAKAWGKQAVVMKWLHYEASMFYQKVDKCIGIPAFFFSSAMGTALVGSAISDDEEISMIITWISAVLSFLTAGFIGVLFYLDPGTLSQRHLQKSVYFDDAYHDIQLELSMDPTDRQAVSWFLQFIQRKMALAQNLPPTIPQRFWKQQQRDVVDGQMARDLRDLDQYFMEVLGVSLQKPLPFDGSAANAFVTKDQAVGSQAVGGHDNDEENGHDNGGQEDQENGDQGEPSYSSFSAGCVKVEMEESPRNRRECAKSSTLRGSPVMAWLPETDLEHELELQKEMNLEIQRIRREQKQKREQYQLSRYHAATMQ